MELNEDINFVEDDSTIEFTEDVVINDDAIIDAEETTETRGKRVLAEVQAGAKRLKQSAGNYANILSEDYWFAVSFVTPEQKQAFLQAMDWAQFGDMYLSGAKVAAKQNIVLPKSDATFVNPARQVDPQLADMALPLKE